MHTRRLSSSGPSVLIPSCDLPQKPQGRRQVRPLVLRADIETQGNSPCSPDVLLQVGHGSPAKRRTVAAVGGLTCSVVYWRLAPFCQALPSLPWQGPLCGCSQASSCACRNISCCSCAFLTGLPAQARRRCLRWNQASRQRQQCLQLMAHTLQP